MRQQLLWSYNDLTSGDSQDSSPFQLIDSTQNPICLTADDNAQHARDLWELAVSATQEGLWEWDILHNRVWYSQQFKALLALSAEEEFPNVCCSWEKRCHRVDRVEVLNCLQRHIDHNEPFDVETRMRLGNGQYRWFRVRGNSERNSHGQATRMAGLMEDIHERRLRDEESRRHTEVLESTSDIVCEHGRDLQLSFINSAGKRLLNINGFIDITGFRVSEFYTDWAKDLMRSIAYPSAIENGIWSGETALLTTDGMEIAAWTILIAHRNEDGEIESFTSVSKDLTEIRTCLQELREKERQLLHAQRMESVGALAGGVAHEFNNLLQAITGHASFALMDVPKNSSPYEDLIQIMAAGERASSLTRKLLNYSRTDETSLERVELTELIADLVKFLKPVLGKGVELEVEQPPAQRLEIMADRIQLSQALMNIALNARDAMNSEGRLTIRLYAHSTPVLWTEPHAGEDVRHFAIIEISDTGCGITEDVKEKIFDPFFTTKEVGKGTGLGLSLVYGTVSKHQGIVEVDSMPDVGTTFRVKIPMLSGNPIDCPSRLAIRVFSEEQTSV